MKAFLASGLSVCVKHVLFKVVCIKGAEILNPNQTKLPSPSCCVLKSETLKWQQLSTKDKPCSDHMEITHAQLQSHTHTHTPSPP